MLTITLPDCRSTREALAALKEHARQERDWCDENGRSSRAEAFERFAVAVEETVGEPASAEPVAQGAAG